MKESREDSLFYSKIFGSLGLIPKLTSRRLGKPPSLRTATSRDTYISLEKKSFYNTYLTKIEEMTHQNSGKDKNAPSDDS